MSIPSEKGQAKSYNHYVHYIDMQLMYKKAKQIKMRKNPQKHSARVIYGLTTAMHCKNSQSWGTLSNK